MEKLRRLDASGQGRFSYDYENDVLTFSIKNRSYKQSIEFENFVVDIDTEDYIIGVRFFDASLMFKRPKAAFKQITQFHLEAKLELNVVSVQLSFVCKYRNKSLDQVQNLVRDTQQNLPDSQVVCAA